MDSVTSSSSKLFPISSSSPTLLPNGGGAGGGGTVGAGGVSYIEHPVSKLDTLAGVAIKYGVEKYDDIIDKPYSSPITFY
ncbi:unnamed protein product [Ilex paraguariensis]|uniref:Uncharacterized protein n=1 Tax=Ilex paraguariensis TaxID=185542 RepID=A0ABC8S5L7_9AQUA